MTPDDLRAWREEAGLSQEGLAHLLGVSSPTIAEWEEGLVPIPKWLTLALIGWRASHTGKSSKTKKGGPFGSSHI